MAAGCSLWAAFSHATACESNRRRFTGDTAKKNWHPQRDSKQLAQNEHLHKNGEGVGR